MMKFYAMVFAAVSEFALSIVLFYYLGAWLEKNHGVTQGSTWLTIIGLVVGLVLVTFRAKKLMQSEESKDEKT